MENLVSIIIPVYNEEKNIENCLKAVRRQTYPKVEVIVVDNGSTDASSKIAKDYADKVIFEERKGVYFAYNSALKVVQGELIAITDADCVPDEKWVEELVRCFSDLEVGSAGGPNITPSSATNFEKYVGILLGFLSKSVGSKYISDIKDIIETFHNPECNVMYRKSILDNAGGWNDHLLTAGDEEIDFRIRAKGYKILYTPYAKVYHNRKSDWKSFIRQIYSYAIGRIQFIKSYPHIAVVQWPRFMPSFFILFGLIFFIIGLFESLFLKILLCGTFIGIIVLFSIAIYLAFKSKRRGFSIYLLLLFFTFWVYGIGFIRGIWYRQR